MRATIRVWMVITLSILVWVLQFNVVTDIKSSHYVKEDLELALHDAGLFIRPDQLAEGYVVFDRDLAFRSFVDSFEKNTGLTNMKPVKKQFFQDEFKVVAFEVLDDSNTNSYPFVFKHPSYVFEKRFDGPTIIAIIETYGPRFFNGEKRIVRRAASYTYRR